MAHLFDNSSNNVYTKEFINLSVGAPGQWRSFGFLVLKLKIFLPGPDLLETCCQLFKDATDERMEYERKNNSFLFQYGPVIGLSDFREQMALFLTKNYSSPVNEDNLVLTSGASHGLHLILTMFLHPKALIIVDEVTYMIALANIGNFPELRIVSCPLQGDGPDMDRFEEIVNKFPVEGSSEGNRFHAMYYTIPVHHNPTGICFSQEKCRKLIDLSRKHNFLIACDDVYNLLGYEEGDRIPRMFELDNPSDQDYRGGTVISNGSFSKILSPGVRVGWMECPKWAKECLESGW